jgi:NAD+ diphosphatase
VLVVERGQALLAGDALVLVAPADAPEGDRLYLGTQDGAHFFAVTGPLPVIEGAQPSNLRDAGAVLSDTEAGLLAHAIGLANWHAVHPRCARCGEPTEATRGGSVRRCTACGTEHFPRTDPAIIVLVTDGADRCVLGRQASWPERRFSTLAGFVEPGESLEQAVAREVFEESGVVVTSVSYRGSQPWPFPASLMLGFRAECAADAVPAVGDGELAEVRWWTREQVRAAGQWGVGDGELVVPPGISIASELIQEWLSES